MTRKPRKRLNGDDARELPDEMTVEEFRALVDGDGDGEYVPELFDDGRGKKRSKFNNVPVEYDGFKFDSLAECDRYKQLRVLEQDGRILGLLVHPVWILVPAFRDRKGKKQRAATYECDFRYQEGDQIVCEDVKGTTAPLTQRFKLAWKIVNHKYPDIDWRIVRMDAERPKRSRTRSRRRSRS